MGDTEDDESLLMMSCVARPSSDWRKHRLKPFSKPYGGPKDEGANKSVSKPKYSASKYEKSKNDDDAPFYGGHVDYSVSYVAYVEIFKMKFKLNKNTNIDRKDVYKLKRYQIY